MDTDDETARDPAVLPRLGILVLDTAFPRIAGDLGNPETWSFPTLLYAVKGATPTRVAGNRAAGLFEAFVEGGEALVRQGAAGIITTCGFASILQQTLTERLPVPVATSTLLQVPLIERMLPAGKRVGILTYSKAFLGPEHLLPLGIDVEIPVEGVPGDGVFFDVITHGAEHFEFAQMEAEVVAAGRRLMTNHRDVGAIVVECANMPPYTAALRQAVGVPVYDGVGFVTAFYYGLVVPSPDNGADRG